MCKWGYVLLMRMIPVVVYYDLCQVNPCEHGGSCYVFAGVYHCFCEQNYHGDRCQGACSVCALLNKCVTLLFPNYRICDVAKLDYHEISRFFALGCKASTQNMSWV